MITGLISFIIELVISSRPYNNILWILGLIKRNKNQFEIKQPWNCHKCLPVYIFIIIGLFISNWFFLMCGLASFLVNEIHKKNNTY